MAPPDAFGCMWMMSVPIATCAVSGMPSRADAHAMLARANGGCAAERYAATDCPSPMPRETPSVMAPLSSRPVSSAMPKRPGPSASSTSSEVDPASAISKSWMMPAPFVANADTKPRSARSTRIGARPVFTTCAPKPQMMPPPESRAAAMAAATALKSAAPRMPGRLSTNAATPAPFACGFAKSSTLTLLARDASGYVATSDRSNSS